MYSKERKTGEDMFMIYVNNFTVCLFIIYDTQQCLLEYQEVWGFFAKK